MLPTPLRHEIKVGVTLRATKISLPSELRAEIEKKHQLHHVPMWQPTKRAFEETMTCNETPVPAPPAKRARMVTVASPSPYNFRPFMKPGTMSENITEFGMRCLFRGKFFHQ